MNIRNKGLAVLAGVGIAGLVGAAAASLDLTTNSLGSDTEVIAACDPDGITVDYTTVYNSGTQLFDVTEVVLSGVDAACSGLDYEIVLTDGGATLTSTTGTAASTTTTAALSTFVDAALVDGISVIISG